MIEHQRLPPPPAVPIDSGHTPFGLATVIYRWLLVCDEADRRHALPQDPLRPSLYIKVGVSGDLSVVIGPVSR